MNSLKKKYFYILTGLFYLILVPTAVNADNKFKEKLVVYSPTFGLKGYLCRPEGEGPFAAVIYNHGGMGNKIGGAPRETCQALAEAGFVGFSPFRRLTIPMAGHLDDIFAAVDFVSSLEYVDSQRLGIMGFSRGGHLAFVAAARRPVFKAVVIMAAAPGGRNQEEFLSEAPGITAPVLLMVAENDKKQADHVIFIKKMKSSLEDSGKDVQLMIYPPFEDDGHQMFFEIGDYWQDVAVFLKRHL